MFVSVSLVTLSARRWVGFRFGKYTKRGSAVRKGTFARRPSAANGADRIIGTLGVPEPGVAPRTRDPA